MPVGLTKDAGWQIGVSRTVPHAIDDVWQAVITNAGDWLGPGATLPDQRGDQWAAADGSNGELRSRRERDRVRVTYRARGDTRETTVQVTVRATATGTVLRFHQERMLNAAERERRRAHWEHIIAQLRATLA